MKVRGHVGVNTDRSFKLVDVKYCGNIVKSTAERNRVGPCLEVLIDTEAGLMTNMSFINMMGYLQLCTTNHLTTYLLIIGVTQPWNI